MLRVANAMKKSDTITICFFLAIKQIAKRDHPPYSPNLVPCYIWLFPKMKTTAIKGCRFSDVSSIQRRGQNTERRYPNKDFISSFREFYCQTLYIFMVIKQCV